MIDLFTIHNGQSMLSAEAMAVLFGLPVGEVKEAIQRAAVGDGFALPADWVRRGRLRAKEAEAATGETGIRAAIEYWLDREGVR